MNKWLMIGAFIVMAFGIFYMPFSPFVQYVLYLEGLAAVVFLAGALFFEKDEDFIDEDEE